MSTLTENYRVLVAEKIAATGVDLLKERFDVEVGTDWTREELLDRIGSFHGILIRSATQLDAEVIDRADNLKVVGRAGVGVDNVDVQAASKKGITGMRHSISNTAEYGDLTRGKRIITDQTRQNMKDVLTEIQDGTFAREWIAENRAGQENFQRLRAEGQANAIETEGKELRSMMAWIDTEFEEG